MKAISIYKTKKKYKFITMFLTETGTYIIDEPISFLDLNTNLDVFCQTIFDSLKNSKLIQSSDIVRSRKELLKKMKEPSFKALYSNSNSCYVYWEDNSITIEPKICKNPKEGLEVVEEDIVTVQYTTENELNIAKTIYEILQKNYSTDSPSM